MHKQAIQMESFLTCILWFHHKSLNTNICEFHCWVNAYQNESIHLDNKWYCFTQVSDSSSLWNIEILLNPQKLMSTILDETTLLFTVYVLVFICRLQKINYWHNTQLKPAWFKYSIFPKFRLNSLKFLKQLYVNAFTNLKKKIEIY